MLEPGADAPRPAADAEPGPEAAGDAPPDPWFAVVPVPGGLFGAGERGAQAGEPAIAEGGADGGRLPFDVGAGQVEVDVVEDRHQTAPEGAPPGPRRGERRDQARFEVDDDERAVRPLEDVAERARLAGVDLPGGQAGRVETVAEVAEEAAGRGAVFGRDAGDEFARQGQPAVDPIDGDGAGDAAFAVPVLGEAAGEVAPAHSGFERGPVGLVGERRLEGEPVERPRQQAGGVDLGHRVVAEEDQAGKRVCVGARFVVGEGDGVDQGEPPGGGREPAGEP